MQPFPGVADIILIPVRIEAGVRLSAAGRAFVADAKTIYTSKKFVLEQRTVQLDGGPHVFDIIRHPGAAVILPLLDNAHVVLIANNRVAVGQELLELPAGTLDAGEAPDVCAARELAEETGYRAGRITPLVTFYSSPGLLSERMHVFVARDLTAGASALEAGEQIQVRTVPLADALDWVRTGRITDGKTMLALLYYDRFGGTARTR